MLCKIYQTKAAADPIHCDTCCIIYPSWIMNRSPWQSWITPWDDGYICVQFVCMEPEDYSILFCSCFRNRKVCKDLSISTKSWTWFEYLHLESRSCSLEQYCIYAFSCTASVQLFNHTVLKMYPVIAFGGDHLHFHERPASNQVNLIWESLDILGCGLQSSLSMLIRLLDFSHLLLCLFSKER